MSAAPLALLLAGGTGGHVYPALAVGLNLRERGFRLAWIGTARGLEARVVPEAGIDLHHLPMRGLRGKGIVQQVQALVLLGVSLLSSIWLMLRLRPAVVIGMGGYASVPAALAAWMTRRPLMLQEQNAVAGSANRGLSRFARAIATGFPNVLTSRGGRYLGNPVRQDLLTIADTATWSWDGVRPLRILVLGGSLGARPLNRALPAVAAKLGERCEWWHQCGNDHLIETREAYAQTTLRARVDAYLEDMPAAYGWADLVICRAGALTVAELAVTGRPSVLVPLPHAIDDHQRMNAMYLVDGGAALHMPQDRLADELVPALESLLADPDALQQMASASLTCGRPSATADISDIAVELAS